MTTLDPSMHAGKCPAAQARDRAMIVHDLRGALQGVLGGVAMLDAVEVAAGARGQIDRVAASAQALACLLQGLLGDESISEQCVAHAWIDLPRFVEHLGKRWGGEADERGLRFRVDVAADLSGKLRADPMSLARALGNLIGNAFAHGRSGDVRLALRRTSDGGVAFDVLDDGPGLPQSIIDRVLRPGLIAVGVSNDGHGLGLHIARTLCAEMGGSFTLANRPGGGVAAGIAFPGALYETNATADVAAPAAPDRMDLSGMRILLAEDNPTNQMVATQMLRALNAEVTLASDGVEALERFEAAEFDIVVVDIEMPRMSGLDVIRAIRGRKDGRAGVPIVALTAYVMREHRERIAAAGANGLISKPIISVEALGKALRVHMATVAAPSPQATEAQDTAVSEEPVADLAIYQALCAAIGDGMMAELLEKVVADLMQARADLAGALTPLDRRPIRSASHILISVAGAIGATRLQSCARALNVAAQAEDSGGISADVRRCIDEIDAAIAFADSRRAPA